MEVDMAEQTPKYFPVPISAAKTISEIFEKDQVIVVAWDRVHGKTHITTYGKNREECRQAALGGEAVAAALGLNVPHVDPEAKEGVSVDQAPKGVTLG